MARSSNGHGIIPRGGPRLARQDYKLYIESTIHVWQGDGSDYDWKSWYSALVKHQIYVFNLVFKRQIVQFESDVFIFLVSAFLSDMGIGDRDPNRIF